MPQAIVLSNRGTVDAVRLLSGLYRQRQCRVVPGRIATALTVSYGWMCNRMVESNGAPLLNILCDVARVAERQDVIESRRSPVRVKKVEPVIVKERPRERKRKKQASSEEEEELRCVRTQGIHDGGVSVNFINDTGILYNVSGRRDQLAALLEGKLAYIPLSAVQS